MSEKQGTMFVLSSPSGVGKTTLTKMLAKRNPNCKISISYTTRKPRINETNGKDYYFVNEKQFEELIKKNSFFEHATIFNNLYGTLKEPVLKLLSSGKDVLFDIDWQGTQQLKRKIKNLKLIAIFILPPSTEALKNRLLNRDQDGKQIVEQRMKIFKEEVLHWMDYDYVVINDDLNICFDQINSIIECEKNGKKYNYDSSTIKKIVQNLTK